MDLKGKNCNYYVFFTGPWSPGQYVIAEVWYANNKSSWEVYSIKAELSIIYILYVIKQCNPDQTPINEWCTIIIAGIVQGSEWVSELFERGWDGGCGKKVIEKLLQIYFGGIIFLYSPTDLYKKSSPGHILIITWA